MSLEFAFDNTPVYARIARNAHERILEFRRDFPPMPNFANENEDELTTQMAARMHAEDSCHRHALVAIVFSAMSVEALINTIGMDGTSKSYFEKYLDKLDLVAKWVVIPKLSGLGELNREGTTFERLTMLVRDRNRLVHSKLKTFVDSEDAHAHVRKIGAEQAAADNAIVLLDELQQFLGEAGDVLAG